MSKATRENLPLSLEGLSRVYEKFFLEGSNCFKKIMNRHRYTSELRGKMYNMVPIVRIG